MIIALVFMVAALQTQLELDQSATADFARADATMNAQYRETMTLMRRWDARLKEPSHAAALLKAQRTWLAYRDAECVAEGSVYLGGSMQALTFVNCKARLTRARTAELKQMNPEAR